MTLFRNRHRSSLMFQALFTPREYFEATGGVEGVYFLQLCGRIE
jgi:hypothetical protein